MVRNLRKNDSRQEAALCKQIAERQKQPKAAVHWEAPKGKCCHKKWCLGWKTVKGEHYLKVAVCKKTAKVRRLPQGTACKKRQETICEKIAMRRRLLPESI